MTPTLRPYQSEAVDEIRQGYQQGHRSVLFVLPTGGGKTVLFSHITRETAARGNRVCVLVHRAELLRQASASLTALGVPHGLIAAGRSMNLAAPVQVASVQSLVRRLHLIPQEFFQLLVIDEAHHSNAGTWAKVLKHCASARVLGVTATPCRSDGRGLGEWYSHMVLGPTPAELTDAGFLAQARVFAPPGPSLLGLRKRMGDYDMEKAGEMMQQGDVMGDCLAHYRRHLDGQTAIAFCCSVAHSVAVAEMFQREGVDASYIDGTMDAGRREQLLTELGAGRLKVLTSCQLIGEGVDVPSVAGCILLRPTQSVSLHLQMIGRCLRPQPGKTAVILDHVGNYKEHGHHLEDREWSLDGTPKRDREKAPSIKNCPECFATVLSGVLICPECGHEFVEKKRAIRHIEGDLVEIKPLILQAGAKVELWFGSFWAPPNYVLVEWPPSGSALVAHSGDTLKSWRIKREHVRLSKLGPQSEQALDRKREQSRAQTLEDLVQIGKRRGMKNPTAWARHVMAARQNRSHAGVRR
jgi:superfamily II DNA or RNA helicase